MNAPATEAKKLAKNPFPPTEDEIHREGIIPLSVPGMPRRKPATRTPPRSKGAIMRVYIHVESSQFLVSSDEILVT